MLKINKSKARKLFNEGIDIYVCPHKLSPYYLDSIFVLKMNKVNTLKGLGTSDFDFAIDSFITLKCNTNETDRYPAYYIKANHK